jgi:hypothetical protein
MILKACRQFYAGYKWRPCTYQSKKRRNFSRCGSFEQNSLEFERLRSIYVFRQLPATGSTPERGHSLTLQLSRCIAPLDPINKPDWQVVIGSVCGHQLMQNHSSATLLQRQFVTSTRDWNSSWPSSSLQVGERRDTLILVQLRQEGPAHIRQPPLLLQ